MKRLADSPVGLPGRKAASTMRRIMYCIAAAFCLAVFLLVTVPFLINRPVKSVHASIAVPVIAVDPRERGYVDEVSVKVGDQVRTGDPIVTVRRRAEPRTQFALTSPCDCTVVDLLGKRGTEALAGEPLAHLAPIGSDRLMVEAAFPADAIITTGVLVDVLIEGAPQPGRGRIVEVNAGMLAADLYGLPHDLANGYQIAIVGELDGFDNIRPGMAARVQLMQ
jgi:multidrug resistance efflux pump